jgi:hypothetical protein
LVVALELNTMVEVRGRECLEGSSVAMDGHRAAYMDVLVAIPGKHSLPLTGTMFGYQANGTLAALH